jgi:hypothetical protein
MNFEEAVAVPVEFALDADVIAGTRWVVEVLPYVADYFGADVKGPSR